MALLGSGFDPGATNVFTVYQAKHHFDTVHYLDIVDSRVVFDDMIRLHGGEDDGDGKLEPGIRKQLTPTFAQ